MQVQVFASMPLSHHRRGSGPPLVLIHGIGSHWHMWQPVLELLAAEREVFAVDLPGFGESTMLRDKQPTVGDLASAVAKFMAAQARRTLRCRR